MAREGITYEQVAAAADALVAEGKQPTIRAVREQLRGTGSPNTIHRHLSDWRAARPQAVAAAPELPGSIIREIRQEIERAAAQARAGIEERLVQVQAEAADLAAAGEALEAERDGLLEQIAVLTSERDRLAGQAAEQAAEIVRQGEEIERERRAAENARIEVAQNRLKIEAQGEAVAEHRAEVERLRAALEEERQARTEAERQQAVLEAGRASLAERLVESQAREQATGRDLVELRARVDKLTEIERTMAGELAQAKAGAGDVERLRAEVVEARKEAQAKAVECARLVGQVEALQGHPGKA